MQQLMDLERLYSVFISLPEKHAKATLASGSKKFAGSITLVYIFRNLTCCGNLRTTSPPAKFRVSGLKIFATTNL